MEDFTGRSTTAVTGLASPSGLSITGAGLSANVMPCTGVMESEFGEQDADVTGILTSRLAGRAACLPDAVDGEAGPADQIGRERRRGNLRSCGQAIAIMMPKSEEV